LPLQACPATHGGLTPVAPGARRSLDGEKATFAMHKRVWPRTRVGGVSPPCLRHRDCTDARQRTVGSLPSNGASAFASASARHRAGSRPPLLVCKRLYIVKVAISPVGELARTRAGGVSPPCLRHRDCTDARQRTVGSLPSNGASAFASALPIRHGGLTPVAPGARRSLDGEKATFAMHKRVWPRTRAGGVSPPCLRHRDCTDARQRTGGSLPNKCVTPLHGRFPTHGGLTPAAAGYPRGDRVRMCADCPRRRDSRTT